MITPRKLFNRLLSAAAAPLERGLRAVPTVNRRLEGRYDEMLSLIHI